MYTAAQEAAQRSIDLNPETVDGYLAMYDFYRVYDWDWTRAAQAAESAQRLQPANPSVLNALADLASTLGQWETAIQIGRQALARDPLSAGAHEGLGNALYCSGQYAAAEAEYRRSLQLFPEGGLTQSFLARTLMLQGRLAEAVAIAQQDPTSPFRLWALAMIYHTMGRRTDADAALAEFKRQFHADGVAWVYANWGELDNAYQWFDQAYTRHDTALTYIKCMPEAPAFIRDPRYKLLLRKMKLPE